LAKREYKKAISVLRKAIHLSPNYEYAHYLLGRAYTADGKTVEAISAFAKAPNIARAYDEWGRILAKKGDYELAVEKFEKAAEMNTKFSDAFGNIAWYLAEGGLLVGDGLSRAVQAAKREIELCKDTNRDWHGYAVLGHIYYCNRDLESAREALDEALKLTKNSTQVYYYQALVDFDEGNYHNSRDNLIELFKLNEKDEWHNKAVILMNEVKEKLSEQNRN
jgi:tetratricopeptide (TPR) repeat protein